ncbi:CPBP family intramembrane glutamic endopeptidase [Actinomycetes bacterium KLBMP 9797]
MRPRVLTIAGLLLFAAAFAGLLLTGHTEVRTSADDEAPLVPLAAVVVPLAAGLLLTRLVPPRLPSLPRTGGPARQAYALVGLALAYPALILLTGTGPWYGLLKVTVLLGGGWLVLRIWRADAPGGRMAGADAAAHRRALRPAVRWLAPLPALAAWVYLAYYSPLTGDQDLSEYREWDRVYLAVAMLLTFLTASVTEELFYRVMLQSRLEARLGRWPAIMASALLFALMHVNRLHDGPPGVMLAVIVLFNGGFGLFVGYLWARYRSLPAIIATHGAVNSLVLLPLFLP